MIIKKAEQADVSEIVELIRMAIDDMAMRYTGYEDAEAINRALKDLVCQAQTRFSYNYIHVARYKNQIVGQITAYPADQLLELNVAFEGVFNQNADNRSERLKAVLEAKEGIDGEFYIDSLAIHPNFRGQGVGKLLIKEAEMLASSQGYDKISLLVDLNNSNAEALYEKLNFQVDRHMNVLGHQYKHMVKCL